MKAVDERAAMGRVKPRAVGLLVPPDIRVEFPYSRLNPPLLLRRCIRRKKRIGVHCVRHSVDHYSVSKWHVRRGQCLLVFLHDLDVVVEEPEYALDHWTVPRVLRSL